MPQTFGRGKCRAQGCDREVTVCGYGEWQHLRAHYRKLWGQPAPKTYGVLKLLNSIADAHRSVRAARR